VTVPDERLDRLGALIQPKQVLHATVEFVDIAGLVKGASHGEGLGNQFLGHIRDTAAIVHVVRCFDDDNVVHISAHPAPREDIEIVNTELILADLQQLDRKMEKLRKQAKGDRKLKPVMDLAQTLKTHLESGKPLRQYADRDDGVFHEFEDEMRFLTAKTVIYAANVDEDGLGEENAYVAEAREVAAEEGAEVVKLCAKLEEEMAGMTDAERHEYLELSGVEESGLEQVIHRGFRALDLISFFTVAAPKEVRAWQVRRGATAPKAAGVIHTDFERGFIRAKVIPIETYLEHGGEAGAKAAGAMRAEGKDYVVHDGDVIYFRFNV